MEHTMKQFMQNIKKSNVVKEFLPLGYGPGLPIVQIKNKKLCILVPFFKFMRVNQVDQSRIFPIHYTATFTWPDGVIVAFENLAYNEVFEKVDFQKAIGLFRHDAIKTLNSAEYHAKRDELYGMYDQLTGFIAEDKAFSKEDEENFISLLNMIIEPSLVPIYYTLDPKFSKKFINQI